MQEWTPWNLDVLHPGTLATRGWNHKRTVLLDEDLPLPLDLRVAGMFRPPILKPPISFASFTEHIEADDGRTVNGRSDLSFAPLSPSGDLM